MELELQAHIHVLFTSCFFLLVRCYALIPSSSQGSKLPYMTSSMEQISGKSFDYIVVGGGASGCPLVATLSQKFTVLLIERGGSPCSDPMATESSKYGLALVKADEFSSIAQSFVSEEGVMNHRGRVLGGSTAINAGFYSRAGEDFVERLGWEKRLVREAYEWVESKVVFKPDKLSKWQSIIKNSLVKGAGLGFNGFSLEHIAGTKVGGSIFDGKGKRHSSADLLRFGNANKITVLLNATVKNVIVARNGRKQQPKATGVRFIKSGKEGAERVYEVYLNKQQSGDVILCAGALGSPQILMLSGIGPREHLKHFNISPIVDATQVGNPIQDNPSLSFILDSPGTLKPDPPKVVGITQDFQVIIESGIVYISQNATRWRLGAKMTFPVSKGKLRLKSTDPRQNPSVRFNYLKEKKDLDQCVKMDQLLEKITEYIGGNQRNGSGSAEQRREFCKKNVRTFYHYHGGCGIGSVIDKDYKVYGVDGLRVVDGSTLPDSPGTNPMATLLMLGRYQGNKMLEKKKGSVGYMFW